jgi:hypothetical protein
MAKLNSLLSLSLTFSTLNYQPKEVSVYLFSSTVLPCSIDPITMPLAKIRKVVDYEWVQNEVFSMISENSVARVTSLEGLQRVVDTWQKKSDSTLVPIVSFRP